MTLFTSSVETQAEITALCRLFRELSIGAVLTYGDASRVIGRDVQTVARFSWIRARDIVEKEDGIRFGTVHAQGAKRLTAEDIPAIGAQARRRIRRTARKGAKRLRNLRGVNAIDADVQRRIDAEVSALGAIALVTTEHAARKIETEVRQTGAEIPVGRTFDLFKK